MVQYDMNHKNDKREILESKLLFKKRQYLKERVSQKKKKIWLFVSGIFIYLFFNYHTFVIESYFVCFIFSLLKICVSKFMQVALFVKCVLKKRK